MSIREVARRAGVSTATVSRTLNSPEKVSKETAARVHEAVTALRYVPNTHARSLVSGRSRILGLIISDIANPFFPQLVKAFEERAMEFGHEVLVTNTNYDATRMALCVRRMLERQVDGVAIMTSEMDPELTEQLTHRDVPVVFLDFGKVTERTSNIRIDYESGIQAAVEHLAELGHRRVGFISGPMSLKSARLRRQAFLRGLRDFGMRLDNTLVVEGNHRIDGGEGAMRELLGKRNAPTAVLTSNDLSAVGALRAVDAAGLNVPADISIIGFDDIALAAFTHPPLTTVRISLAELGRTAFDSLLRVISGESQHGEEYRVGTCLVVRESTGRASTVPSKPVPRKKSS